MNKQPKHDPTATGIAGVTRRTYSRPKFIEYGSVAKLTQSGGSTKDEGTVVAKQMKCL